ncbi:hypothetical protein [Paraburkholderia megapolitana]|uniref:hypothetical protein n=1 Tax=Paraburkholderia megapolitana TaxID=420953 RepID=UPI0038BCEFFD
MPDLGAEAGAPLSRPLGTVIPLSSLCEHPPLEKTIMARRKIFVKVFAMMVRRGHDYWLAALAGVLTTGASMPGAYVALAAALRFARLAASLSPAVPLAPAELLMTPLLPELMTSLPLSSTRLHPDATVSATIDRQTT